MNLLVYSVWKAIDGSKLLLCQQEMHCEMGGCHRPLSGAIVELKIMEVWGFEGCRGRLSPDSCQNEMYGRDLAAILAYVLGAEHPWWFAFSAKSTAGKAREP